MTTVDSQPEAVEAGETVSPVVEQARSEQKPRGLFGLGGRLLPEGLFSREGVTASYVTKEVLLGVTIGFAQVPESVAFAFLAHVRPHVALHAAWIVGLFCSLLGGRPGMVNGATGAFAAIIATFLPAPTVPGGNGAHVELLFPSVIVAGLFMLAASAANLSRFILLLPAPVMVGFCNGLAIVIGMAQLHPFRDEASASGWKSGPELLWMLLITFVAMVTMEFLPKVPLNVFKVIPSSLVAILLAVALEFAVVRPSGAKTATIGDVSEFTAETAFPIPFFVDHPSTGYNLAAIVGSWTAVKNIVVQGFLLCVVGAIESLMTSEVVESFAKTPSEGDRTVFAMGLGNIVSGFFGGMGGNAMIGLSTINVLNGGRGRMAPTCTALVVMASVMGAYRLLNYIPVAALAGIMIVVVLHTFKWFSLGMIAAALLPKFLRDRLNLHRKVPRIEALVVFVVTVVSKEANIALAVVTGVAICAVSHAWNSGHDLQITEAMSGAVKIYNIEGALFFTSANRLLKYLDPEADPEEVEVRFGQSSLMDFTSVEVLNKLALSYKACGKTITFHTLNLSSQKIIEKANHLVTAIEYTDSTISVPRVPSFTDGFRADPMVAEGVFDSVLSRAVQEPEACKDEDLEKACPAEREEVTMSI
eukprot:gb/GFBE01037031.1/.p1 GENE.gb/GFBE01037031.1/~~gb/GFBE01037031.1/.p1  ORF type:complete len:644 (+),score=158.38 gb/GFBE01037031.1/:1-1932(+)